MKEEKGLAPGIYFGHMKCINHESDAALIISKLALLPLKTGYTPIQWLKGINTMIPKKKHDYNLFAEEQYVSRKEKLAILHATNKRLVTDHLCQFRQPAIYFANNAKSCYDRILHIVAYCMMRIHGISKTAAKCSVGTISDMAHHIRTSFGDSKSYYGGKKWTQEGGKNPHGNGQGNGDGPAAWTAISFPLLKILREEGYGIRFSSPITGLILHSADKGETEAELLHKT